MRNAWKTLLLCGAALLLTGCGRKDQPHPMTEPESTMPVTQATVPEPTAPPPATILLPETTTAPDTTTDTTTRPTDTTAETTYTIDTTTLTESAPVVAEAVPDKNGVYTTKDDVALYIYTYGALPKNFITKKEAQALGWEGGSLEPYAPGCCIGGSYFGNFEGALPSKKGRKYTECDIDTLGKSSRGAKRIVFSNDGLIYYTDDHYNTFTLLYGEESS